MKQSRFYFPSHKIWLDMLNLPLCTCVFHLRPSLGTWNRPWPLTPPCKSINPMKKGWSWRTPSASAVTMYKFFVRRHVNVSPLRIFSIYLTRETRAVTQGQDCALGFTNCWHCVTLNSALGKVKKREEKTSQELWTLSSVTLNCQVRKNIMNSGFQLQKL